MTRHVADVLPAGTGHHLTGGHHADRGGGHGAGVQADHGDGDTGTEQGLELQVGLKTINVLQYWNARESSLTWGRPVVLLMAETQTEYFLWSSQSQSQPVHILKIINITATYTLSLEQGLLNTRI